MRDEDVRASCFGQLAILCAEFGEDIPYRGGLDRKFVFRGRRVPYRAGDIDQPDNRALRAAFELQTPLAYFVGTRPGWYQPHFPCYVIRDEPLGRRVLVTKGAMVGPLDEQEPVLLQDPIERRYAVREVHVRVHQARFRGRVLPAYDSQCAICRLKEVRLLDAAHIVGDLEASGAAVVPNGLSLCSIHHRAFDQHLVGISPNYDVHVSRRLLEDEDGPMLDLLKGCHGQRIELPRRHQWWPDGARLAERYDQFVAVSSA